MDNKYPANLDPKLKEAYDRVMGTNVTPSKNAQHHQAHAAPKMVTQQVHNDEPTIVHLGDTPNQHTSHSETSVSHPEQKATSPVLMIVLGVIGVLFFIGYAIFWAQILGFNLIPSF